MPSFHSILCLFFFLNLSVALIEPVSSDDLMSFVTVSVQFSKDVIPC